MSDEDLRSRFRRDYTSEPIAASPRAREAHHLPKPRPAQPPVPSLPFAPVAQHLPMAAFKPRRSRKKLTFLLIFIILAIPAAAVGYKLHQPKQAKKVVAPVSSIVPAIIKNAVSFPIYYPEQSKLPAGYMLDTKSFSASTQAVLYKVDYGNNQKLVFTVQAKPSNEEIDTFYKNQIPLHLDVNTAVGTAAIGGANNQTVVSLPTKSTSWVLISGPLDTDQDKLKQVLQALKQAN